MAYLASAACPFANQLLVGTPREDCRFTSREFKSAVQNKFGLPQSRCVPILGRPITNNVNCPPKRVDMYGHSIKTVTGAQGDGTRQLHDSFQNVVSKWMEKANIDHNGGAHGKKPTCKGTFDQQVNNLQNFDETLERILNGLIPDFVTYTTGKNIEGRPKTLFGDAQTLCDVKSLAPGQAYSESTSTNPADAVKKRESQVTKDYHKAAKKLDEKLGTVPGTIGPVETEMNTYNSGVVAGLVVGAFGELSPALHDLADLIASEMCANYRQFYDMSPKDGRALFLQQVRRSWGLHAHRAWAKLLLDRCRDLVQTEHPNHSRGPAQNWTNEDDAEAHAHFHHHNPPGRRGRG